VSINWASLALVAVGAGVAGWAAENTLFGSRYSAAFGNRKVPFLPVYAAGGALVYAVAPLISDLHPLARAAVYGATFTGLELVAGLTEREQGKTSWAYGPTGEPISLGHSLMWAGLGMLTEQAIRRLP
jgi:hypothetical protein